MTMISGSMPARRQAWAVSYSQLVPGKTGMTALGRVTLCLHTAMERLSQEMGSTASVVPALVGYTFSSTPSLSWSSSWMDTASPGRATKGASVVSPIRRAQSRLISSVSSATMAPAQGAYQFTSSSPVWKPIELPKDIFMTASAKLFSTAQAAFTLPCRCRS